MIDGLKPYTSYHVGGDWFGPTPTHWQVQPNRALFDEVRDKGYPNEQMLSVTIARGVICQSDLLSETSKKDSSRLDRSNYKRVDVGDIAYNKMRAWQGAVGLSRFRGIVSPAYVVMRPRLDHVGRYLNELFRTPAFAREAERWSYGITSDMWSLRPEHFKMIRTPIPPPDECKAIVRFLDHTNQRIDAFIRGKRKLIALLTEQKQATIQELIAPPRLGDSWGAIALGRCLTGIEQGWSPSAAEGELLGEHWSVLSLSAVRRGQFNPSARKPIPRSLDVPDSLRLLDGDVLMTRSNTRERVGDVCLVRRVAEKTIFSDLIYRLRVRPNMLDPRFLVLQLQSRSARDQIEPMARGSSGTMPKLAHTHIKALRIWLPTLEQQIAIAQEAEARLSEIDAAADAIEREIALMREYRARLIADVVTGQLDVREAAQNLPELDPTLTGSAATDPDLDPDALDDDGALDPEAE